MRVSRRLVLISAVVATFTLGFSLIVHADWVEFRQDLTSYQGVSIGMSKPQAEYAVGTPLTVQGPMEMASDGSGVSTPLLVDPSAFGTGWDEEYNVIPPSTSLEDYDHWHYRHKQPSFEIEFNNDGKIQRISCHKSPDNQCDRIFGIHTGMHEYDVITALGDPDTQELEGSQMISFRGERSPSLPIKTMEFSRLGLRLVFTEGRVISIYKTKSTEFTFFEWFRDFYFGDFARSIT